MISENRSAIEETSGIKVAGVIGRIHDFSRPPHDSRISAAHFSFTKIFLDINQLLM
jgi:hypothetical protein